LSRMVCADREEETSKKSPEDGEESRGGGSQSRYSFKVKETSEGMGGPVPAKQGLNP